MSLHYKIGIFKLKADNKNNNFQPEFCLGSISNGLSASESRKVFFSRNVYDFSVDCNSIDKSDILKNKINTVQPY